MAPCRLVTELLTADEQVFKESFRAWVGSWWCQHRAPLGTRVSMLVFSAGRLPAPVSNHTSHTGASQIARR